MWHRCCVTDDMILRVQALDVRYGPLRALFDVSMDATKGSMVALLGPNGAGKSTFGRAVSGLIPIHSGRSSSTATTSPSGPRTAAANRRNLLHP